ncbi:ADP-ribose diphosphatase [Penicillium canariense]|uniref:Bis(5'-adenosyl)-triphosphatase n=1 Tax=Penicillium canariense TaxID=189055 RepID=A0A9W9LTF7_9EURO|nr:ADP-ribose diphosphatase [Penicillium canariense]KAJ5175926.1 ADP-ribose diphosphatase [Penicillium canariense]
MSAVKGVSAPVYFGSFLVTPQVISPSCGLNRLTHVETNLGPLSKQVFHQTPLSFALVNLKPILPGHVLVSSRRVVPRITDLTPAETSDLFLTVRRVGRMVERVYGAASLNIAVQDGVHAGQSVPHVHAHIIPRKPADLDPIDAVYGMLGGEDGDVGKALRETQTGRHTNSESPKKRTRFPVVDNEARKPRSAEEMQTEAEMLGREMEKEALD